ncbi:hypothetical protein RRG08_000104 [Elysia crispata]|uniref:Uncharacterized protein n=1 Tax=Elysia crispata TaxID=231223 RepID=A0AAE1D9N7_9GAST|nr:hypothetical protein RRG08_000104 [Elysia crispata]
MRGSEYTDSVAVWVWEGGGGKQSKPCDMARWSGKGSRISGHAKLVMSGLGGKILPKRDISFSDSLRLSLPHYYMNKMIVGLSGMDQSTSASNIPLHQTLSHLHPPKPNSISPTSAYLKLFPNWTLSHLHSPTPNSIPPTPTSPPTPNLSQLYTPTPNSIPITPPPTLTPNSIPPTSP